LRSREGAAVTPTAASAEDHATVHDALLAPNLWLARLEALRATNKAPTRPDNKTDNRASVSFVCTAPSPFLESAAEQRAELPAADENHIRRWLEAIEETDADVIAWLMEHCRGDHCALEDALDDGQPERVGAEPGDPEPRVLPARRS